MYGVLYIGALMQYACNSVDMWKSWSTNVKGLAGTSIGSLFAFLLQIWTPWEVLSYLNETGFKSIAQNIFDLSAEEAMQFKSVNSGKEVSAQLQTLVERVTGDKNMTMLELYQKTGKMFVVTVNNLTTGRCTYLSWKSAGSVPVWKALRASVSLPFLFAPVEINGQLFCDGGVKCNIPCHVFPPRSTLVFFVNGYTSPTSCYMYKLLSQYQDGAQLGQFRSEPLYAMNSVPCSPSQDSVSAYAFNASSDEITELVNQGKMCWTAVVVRNFMMAMETCRACVGHSLVLF